MAAPNAAPTHRLDWLEPDTLVVALTGHQTGPAITLLIADAGLFLSRKPRFAFFDSAMPSGRSAQSGRFSTTLSVVGFSPNVAGPGADLLGVLKRSGVEYAFASTTLSAVRMMGQTISFAAGLPMRFVATRAEALAGIAQRRAAT